MKKVIYFVLLVFGAVTILPYSGFAEIKIDNLSIKGDLRFRFERHDNDDKDLGLEDNDPKDRLRSRFRLGMKWKNSSEKFEIGAGLATGDESGTSTNSTWSYEKEFETGDIRLDYAYAKHTIVEPFSIIAGQQKNPYKSSFVLWDSDVRPIGFTGCLNLKYFFTTFGMYDVKQLGNDVGMMYALQIGPQFKTKAINFLTALTLYNFSNLGDSDYLPNKDYEYRIIDLYAKLDAKVADKVKISADLSIFNNIGADGKKGEGVLGGDIDPESEDMGWALGFGISAYFFKFGIHYAQVGADSCFYALKDADFGGKIGEKVAGKKGIDTNVEGIKTSLGFTISKHFSLGLTFLSYESMEQMEKVKDYDDDRSMYTFQTDLKYKF